LREKIREGKKARIWAVADEWKKIKNF
jgi:hypothetical protein